MPEDGVDQKQERRGLAYPSVEHAFPQRRCQRQTQCTDEHRDREKCFPGVPKEDVHETRKTHEERIARRLRLMDARIEILKRKSKIDVVHRQVLGGRRNAREQEKREHQYPKRGTFDCVHFGSFHFGSFIFASFSLFSTRKTANFAVLIAASIKTARSASINSM